MYRPRTAAGYSPTSASSSSLSSVVQLLTLNTLGQSQSPLHIPADGLQTVLELLVTVVLLTAARVITAVMLVAAFGHGRDADVKLETSGHLFF